MTCVPRSVKNAVRQRAVGRCEYCHTPEEARPYSFQVEHIRALEHGGSSDLDNLAWACLPCNLRKGTDLATIVGPEDRLIPLFNPRTQMWDDHFELDGALLAGKTLTGQATIQVLQMNHPDQVDMRKVLLEAGLWY